MFPATLFDYNGVLVDDEAVHLAAFRDVLAPLGVSVPEQRYWDYYIGFDDMAGFKAMLADAGRPASDALVRDLVQAKRPHYLRRAEQDLRPFAGAAEIVRRQAEAGPVVIVSGALREEIDFGLERLGVSDCVMQIVSAEDTRHSKPHPEGYLLGIEALAAHLPSEVARGAIVIEDSVAGVEAAKAAKLCCAAVGHSYTLDELRVAGADLAVSELETLTDQVLRQLWEQQHG